MNSNAFDNLHEQCDDALDAISDDAALLELYVAGELDAATRTAVAGRIATEPALAALHASLAGLDARLMAAGRAPTLNFTAAQSDHALNATLRLVREQTLLARQRRAAGAAASFKFRAPGWAWATAAAAALAVGFVVWVTNTEPRSDIIATASNNTAPGEPGNSITTMRPWWLANELGSVFFAPAQAKMEDDAVLIDEDEVASTNVVQDEAAALAEIDALRMLSTMGEDD